MSTGVGFVATPGGHVDEAFEFADRFAERSARFWITARTPQTEALLARERVIWVPEVRSREALRAAGSLRGAFRIMRAERPGLVVSTGAALTVPYMLAARALHTPVSYIESATRLSSPSQTGRIAERVPGIRLHQQGSEWERGGWTQIDSVFDGFVAEPAPPRPPARALVTVGTEQFPFPRMLRVARDALRDVEVAWQTGSTPTESLGLRGDVRAWWSGDELAAAAREVDVVVTHAGVGSILMVLRAGGCPVIVPRMSRHGEHVDEHQSELAEMLERRDLAVVVHPESDVRAAVERAMRCRAVRRG